MTLKINSTYIRNTSHVHNRKTKKKKVTLINTINNNLCYTGSLRGEAGPPISAKNTAQNRTTSTPSKKKILQLAPNTEKVASHPDTAHQPRNYATTNTHCMKTLKPVPMLINQK